MTEQVQSLTGQVAQLVEKCSPIKCTTCNYTASNSDALASHIDTKHKTRVGSQASSLPAARPKAGPLPATRPKAGPLPAAHSKAPKFPVSDILPAPQEQEEQERPSASQQEQQQNSPHPSRVPYTLLVGDSHQKTLKPRLVEKGLRGGRLYAPGYVKPKEHRAYCSSEDWPNARYRKNNYAAKVPELLAQREYTNLIIQAPCNDITNLRNIEDEDEKNALAEQSAFNTLATAEMALKDFPTLERVLVLEQPPRVDGLEELSSYSKFVLRGAVERSSLRNRIAVRSLNSLEYTTDQMKVDIFGSPSNSRSDGIHLAGKKGRQLYTDSILTAIQQSGLPGSWRSERRSVRRGQDTSRGGQQTYAGVVTNNKYSTLSN